MPQKIVLFQRIRYFLHFESFALIDNPDCKLLAGL